jgi:hypothetical protein
MNEPMGTSPEGAPSVPRKHLAPRCECYETVWDGISPDKRVSHEPGCPSLPAREDGTQAEAGGGKSRRSGEEA